MELISLALESWPKIPQLTDNEQAEKVFKILYGNFDAAWTNLIRCQQEASSTKYVRMQHDQRKVLVSLLAEKKKPFLAMTLHSRMFQVWLLISWNVRS